jgi:hypothetical protein
VSRRDRQPRSVIELTRPARAVATTREQSPVPDVPPPIDPRWTAYLQGPTDTRPEHGPPATPLDSDADLAEAIRTTLAPWLRGDLSSRQVLQALRRLADERL